MTAATLPADDQDPALQDLVASAWTAMQDLPPMPAGWFKEPTAEELPPGSGGVHYANGRVYGWVAQAGEPHAGMPGKNLTIESLGDIHLTHFLRQRFLLDDDTYIKAGAFTMGWATTATARSARPPAASSMTRGPSGRSSRSA